MREQDGSLDRMMQSLQATKDIAVSWFLWHTLTHCCRRCGFVVVVEVDVDVVVVLGYCVVFVVVVAVCVVLLLFISNLSPPFFQKKQLTCTCVFCLWSGAVLH